MKPAAEQSVGFDATPSEFALLACFGKHAYATATGAHDAMKRLVRKPDWKANSRGRVLNVYRCAHCHHWHIGSTSRGRGH